MLWFCLVRSYGSGLTFTLTVAGSTAVSTDIFSEISDPFCDLLSAWAHHDLSRVMAYAGYAQILPYVTRIQGCNDTGNATAVRCPFRCLSVSPDLCFDAAVPDGWRSHDHTARFVALLSAPAVHLTQRPSRAAN